MISYRYHKKNPGGHHIRLDGISTGTVINALFVPPVSISDISTPSVREQNLHVLHIANSNHAKLISSMSLSDNYQLVEFLQRSVRL